MKIHRLWRIGSLGLAMACLAACGQNGSSGQVQSESRSASDTETSADVPDSVSETESLADISESEAAGNLSDTDSGSDSQADSSDKVTYYTDWDEVIDIEMMIMDNAKGTTEEMKTRVENAINEITEKEIKVRVHLTYINMGSYAQQVSLMMSSSEPLDLMLTSPMDAAAFSALTSNNQLMEIGSLLKTYGQPALDTVGDLIRGTTIEGGIYAVPVYHVLNTGLSVYIRKDILEDLDLMEQAQNASSWDDVTALYDTILSNEKYANMTAAAPGSGDKCFISKSGSYNAKATFADSLTYDTLGNSNNLIAVVDDSDEVTLNYANQDYKDMIDLMNEWNEKGYVYKDSLTIEGGADLVKNNVAISAIVDTEPGAEITSASIYGYEMFRIPVVNYPIKTSSVTSWTWAVPVTAKEPEAAVAFMSMMYTDSRISNILVWGVEGVDYEVVDGEACYIEGKEDEAYHSSEFLLGNQFLLLPWEGQGADFREKQLQAMEETPISKYLGFTANTDAIANELSALSVVIDEYRPSLDCGFGTDEMYDEFIDKLYANGAQKVIDEYQSQLDAWLAKQSD